MNQKPCKRGNIAPRSKSGHCQCEDCKNFRSKRANQTKNPETLEKWKIENKEKINEYHRQWARDNREKRRKYEYKWRENNPDKVAEMNKKAGSKWASNNKGKRLSSVRARQKIIKIRTPPWCSMDEISKIYEKASTITSQTGIPHEVDHVIPLQGETVCGLHVPENLQILTRFENRSKGVNFNHEDIS